MPEDKHPFKYRIDILKNVPTDMVYGEVANVIPWFGQPVGGTQLDIRFPEKHAGKDWKYQEWERMYEKSYTKVELQSSPNGQFEVLLKNKVRQMRDHPKKVC